MVAALALIHLFDIERFMPHGHCYSWDPQILWTSVISDALIAAAYAAIPFTLVFQIMRRRNDLPFNWMFACFGLFIVACGATHVMEIITVWKPFYALSSLVKVVTALASVPTAIILFRIAPKIVHFPTLQKLVDEQTRRIRAEAANEAKDRFIAMLSHELRTPLTPVKMGLELLEEELRHSEEGLQTDSAREALRMARNNLEMETALINDLLDLSALGHGKPQFVFEPVDFRRVVEDALLRFEEEIRKKKIQLHREISAVSTRTLGAPVRLHQIINNLLSNALKFTSEGGEITVALTNDSECLRFIVKDSGCGIPTEDLDKVFRPFEQLDPGNGEARKGLGLGLAIAQAMARAHHGRLLAQSEGVGRGATFSLELPLSEEPATAEGALSSSSAPSDSDRKPQLLVVDDHADTLVMLSRVLRRAGYQVETAKTVAEAEARLDQCEVLVSDIGLPDGNGCDLMQRFRARGGRAGIAITGFGQEEDIRRSAQAGFSQHLVKPIAIPVLFEALRNVRSSPVA
jgi:signal transduction histidine kinase